MFSLSSCSDEARIEVTAELQLVYKNVTLCVFVKILDPPLYKPGNPQLAIMPLNISTWKHGGFKWFIGAKWRKVSVFAYLLAIKIKKFQK